MTTSLVDTERTSLSVSLAAQSALVKLYVIFFYSLSSPFLSSSGFIRYSVKSLKIDVSSMFCVFTVVQLLLFFIPLPY